MVNFLTSNFSASIIRISDTLQDLFWWRGMLLCLRQRRSIPGESLSSEDMATMAFLCDKQSLSAIHS